MTCDLTRFGGLDQCSDIGGRVAHGQHPLGVQPEGLQLAGAGGGRQGVEVRRRLRGRDVGVGDAHPHGRVDHLTGRVIDGYRNTDEKQRMSKKKNSVGSEFRGLFHETFCQ